MDTHLSQLRSRGLLIFTSQYFRDSATNSFGLLIAAIFPIMIMPVVSRIYSAYEFGHYGLFFAITNLIAVVGAGKYEVAIVIPKEAARALETALVGCIVAIFTATISLIAIVFFGHNFNYLPTRVLWLAPAAILVTIFFNILLNCAIRERLFRAMSLARIAAALATASVMVALGLSGAGAWGLVVAAIFGQLVGITLLSVSVKRAYHLVQGDVSWGGVVRQFSRFSEYPRLAVISDLANSAALRLPIFVFSMVFGATAAGYMVMFHYIWSGTNIIGAGVGETFRQKAAHDFASQGNFKKTYIGTLCVLLAVAVPAWATLTLAGPWLFVSILGEAWREAGAYGQILATLVCIQFVASPLGWAVYIVERLRYNMLWQWSLLFVYVVAFSIGIKTGSEKLTLMLYSASGSFMYLAYLFISCRMSRGNTSEASSS